MKFKSPELQDTFDKIGAVCIPNFISKAQIEEIKGLYEELNINELKGIYSNVKDRSPELNQRINEVFKKCYKSAIEQHFSNYQIGGGAFLIKGTGEGSESSLHQDWNIVDEKYGQSAAIFCPIQDVDENNGCIQVLKGSHKWFKNIRSFDIPSIFLTFKEVQENLIPFPAKAGDAIVFRHNVFHGSKPNHTNQIRIAASVSIATKNSPLIHYKKVGNSIATIKVDDRFFNQEVQSLYQGKDVQFDYIDQKPCKQYQILDDQIFNRYYKEIQTPTFFGKFTRLFK